MFFSEINFEMDPDTKMHRQVSNNVTETLHEDVEEELQPSKSFHRRLHSEIGGLVLRGNRCVLCRSLAKKWKGMRVPSIEPSAGGDEGE